MRHLWSTETLKLVSYSRAARAFSVYARAFAPAKKGAMWPNAQKAVAFGTQAETT